MPTVREHLRNGVRVRAHWRNPADSSRQVGLLFLFVVAIFVLGNKPMGGAAPVDRKPGPQPTVYPIKWPGWDKPVVVPKPTVSYPIVFPSPAPAS
ncbi:hypothetical protein ACFWSF_30835 [Streptomyces sp. NPDC058611]|uniref:hypothetical protein n=1 Tax=unclassified Streptomyces TaxID=2593676 RepID=UPI0036677A70